MLQSVLPSFTLLKLFIEDWLRFLLYLLYLITLAVILISPNIDFYKLSSCLGIEGHSRPLLS